MSEKKVARVESSRVYSEILEFFKGRNLVAGKELMIFIGIAH